MNNPARPYIEAVLTITDPAERDHRLALAYDVLLDLARRRAELAGGEQAEKTDPENPAGEELERAEL